MNIHTNHLLRFFNFRTASQASKTHLQALVGHGLRAVVADGAGNRGAPRGPQVHAAHVAGDVEDYEPLRVARQHQLPPVALHLRDLSS